MRATAAPRVLVRGCGFGVMLWTLELFAFRFDGEAPQKHLHYMEHCRGSWTCLAESQWVCVLCFSALSACKGWGHLVAPVRPGRLIFDVFEAAGVTFWSILTHFGRLGLPVATFQAHLAPESQKLENCAKNCSKMGAFLGPFWLPWAPLGSIREPLEQKWCQKWPKVGICRLCENECFP